MEKEESRCKTNKDRQNLKENDERRRKSMAKEDKKTK